MDEHRSLPSASSRDARTSPCRGAAGAAGASPGAASYLISSPSNKDVIVVTIVTIRSLSLVIVVIVVTSLGGKGVTRRHPRHPPPGGAGDAAGAGAAAGVVVGAGGLRAGPGVARLPRRATRAIIRPTHPAPIDSPRRRAIRMPLTLPDFVARRRARTLASAVRRPRRLRLAGRFGGCGDPRAAARAQPGAGAALPQQVAIAAFAVKPVLSAKENEPMWMPGSRKRRSLRS